MPYADREQLREYNRKQWLKRKNDPILVERDKETKQRYKQKPGVKEHQAKYNKDWRAKQKGKPSYVERCRRECKKYAGTPEAKQKRKEYRSIPENRARERELNRRYLVINGIRVKVDKRPRPVDMTCEVCHRVSGKLDWHHWEDEHPEKGMWLCFPCHKTAENIDAGLGDIYMKLKQVIDKPG